MGAGKRLYVGVLNGLLLAGLIAVVALGNGSGWST